MSSDYLNPNREITKHGAILPHWQQDEAMQFVTFRLGDALPLEKVRHYQRQRRDWLTTYPRPWTAEREQEYHRKFTWRLEHWFDQGVGSCLLKDAIKRQILEEVLMRFEGSRVHHQAWVIMPNHVHLLFKPVHPLADLVGAWKSKSSKQIGLGPIWQRNYRDTMIRDSLHFANAVRYIRRNPLKGKLGKTEFTLWENDRAKAIPS